ncbi:MAG: ATP-binding protein [Candidatus Latescibacteria bacterium]|nr:ATP-binding protein [Candidatus Latescibacterota bacterium]
MKLHVLEISDDLSELHRVNDFLEQLAIDWKIPEKIVFNLILTIEELVSNVINYGFDARGNTIIIAFEIDDGVIGVRIEDKGKAFNPLEMPSPDVEAPAEERRIGGLGIHLAKTLMDSFVYERKGDRNIVTIKKRIVQ